MDQDALEKCPHLFRRDCSDQDFTPENSYLKKDIEPSGRWSAFEHMFKTRKRYLRDLAFMEDVFLPHVFRLMSDNKVLAAELRVDLIDKLWDKEGNKLFHDKDDGRYLAARHFAELIKSAADAVGVRVNIIHSFNGVKDSLRTVAKDFDIIERLHKDGLIVACDLVGHERERLDFRLLCEAFPRLMEIPWVLHHGERSRIDDIENARYSSIIESRSLRRIAHPMALDQHLRDVRTDMLHGKGIEYTPISNLIFGYLWNPQSAVDTFVRLMRQFPKNLVLGSDDPGIFGIPENMTFEMYLLGMGENVSLDDLIGITENSIDLSFFPGDVKSCLKVDMRTILVSLVEAAEASAKVVAVEAPLCEETTLDISMDELCERLDTLVRKIQSNSSTPEPRRKNFNYHMQHIRTQICNLLNHGRLKHPKYRHAWKEFVTKNVPDKVLPLLQGHLGCRWCAALAGNIIIDRMTALFWGPSSAGPLSQRELDQAEQDWAFKLWYHRLPTDNMLDLLTLLSTAWQKAEYRGTPFGDEARYWHLKHLNVLSDPTRFPSLRSIASFCGRTASLIFYCCRSGKGEGAADQTFYGCFGTPGDPRGIREAAIAWGGLPNCDDVTKILDWLSSCPFSDSPDKKAVTSYFAAFKIYELGGKAFAMQQRAMRADAMVNIALCRSWHLCPRNGGVDIVVAESFDAEFGEWLRMPELSEIDDMPDGVPKVKLLRAHQEYCKYYAQDHGHECEQSRDKLVAMLEDNPFHSQGFEMNEIARRSVRHNSMPSRL